MPDDPNNPAPNNPDNNKPGLHELVKAESMVQLALALPAGCLIGWVVGAWLDKHFHQSWIAIAGIVLGAVAGFIQIFTTASRFMKNDK
jgi:ATP synthase protein I